MFKLILKVLLTACAMLLVARFVPGIAVDSFMTALAAALILGALNLTVKPVLTILTLPVTILTLGLFLFVLNAAMFGLAAWLLPGFTVAGFLPALAGSILVTVVSTVFYRILT
jgi:putative membrane protein